MGRRPGLGLHDCSDRAAQRVSVELYRAACERSRRAVAGRSLEEPAALGGSRPFTLRFAFVHLIEETARHLGHLDVLRELLDGTVGE